MTLKGLRTVVPASPILLHKDEVDNSDGVSVANKEHRNDVGVNGLPSGNFIVKSSNLLQRKTLNLRNRSRLAQSGHFFLNRTKGAPKLELGDINVDQRLHERLSTSHSGLDQKKINESEPMNYSRLPPEQCSKSTRKENHNS